MLYEVSKVVLEEHKQFLAYFSGTASRMEDIEGHIQVQGGEVEDIWNKLREMKRFQATRFEELLKGTLDTKCQLQDQVMNVNERNQTRFTKLKEISEAIKLELEDKGKYCTSASEHVEDTPMEETSIVHASGEGLQE